MKCLNCNNDIPDASVVCPFCKSKVEPMASPTPVFNLEATSSLPVTPGAPVLPNDQLNQGNMVVNNTSEVVNSNVGENVMVGNETTNNLNQPVSNNLQGQIASDGVVSNQVEQGMIQNPSMPVNQGAESNNQSGVVLENNINPAYIDPSGELVDGGKIGSSVAPVVKSKNKKKIIIIISVVVVLLIAIGLGIAYYYSQYKTADKRVSKVFSALTSSSTTLKNENIDKSSGTYKMDLSIDYNDEAFNTLFDGTYARDLSSGALDFTINIENLTKGEELLNSPINLELYYNDAKVYVLLQNFYDMYIYDEHEEVKSYFEAIEQNNINYVSLISTLKRALNSGLTSMNSTQTVKSVSIHGITYNANVVSISFNARNQSLFYNNFYRILANDQTFISEIAKLTGKDEDTVKDNLSNANQDKEYEDMNLTLEIVTEKFGNKFLGLRVMTNENFINKLLGQEENSDTKLLEIYPITNGYGLTYKNGSQNVLEGTYEKTLKRTSATNESSYKVYFTYYRGDVAYKIDLSLEIIGDVNPKDAKVNVKNSINKIYLTDEVKNGIIEKYNQHGSVSLYYPDILKNYLGISEATNSLVPDMANLEACAVVTDCSSSNYEGYLICKNQENVDVICQSGWIQ